MVWYGDGSSDAEDVAAAKNARRRSSRSGGHVNGEPATDGGRRNSRIGLAVGAVVVILLLLLVIGNGTSNGPPFSPRSTTESGTRALVRLLEAEGADVELRAGPPLASDDIALVLVDRFASPRPQFGRQHKRRHRQNR